jgi:hypothetical protein
LNTQTETNIHQLAGDVHWLTAPFRFIVRCLLAVVFLLLAPLLYATIPFVCIWADPNSDFSVLALLYMAFAPFASAFWLMMCGVMPDVYRAQKEGRVFEADHVKRFGLMFVGFIGSLGAEVLFHSYLFPIPRYTEDTVANAANWRSWFAGMGIGGFLPIILLLGWRVVKWVCAGRTRCRACHENVGAENLDSLGLCSYCYRDAMEEQENDPEQEAWIHKVRFEYGDRQWASELRRGRRNALKWKTRILTSRQRAAAHRGEQK